ncbi:hypothetical protein AZE42_06368 [Rhizopogon vesiculosus]|uniref:Heterokaryon incompatibility domain-containing protein n=1 Tax=Rhizopogon vesiculosus TaxID=180088 RepID=A0A1J8QS97_9AGAM|nr:hypothetical protein AZE42_06368 [Rhizopogon vesiculosus]
MDTREWEKNLNMFDQYVMNYIPIRLIRISDMKFVERSEVRKHFRGSVPRHKCDHDPASYVKYAILSHRWLDEGEPTYEEMKSGTARGPGYWKLKKFCEKAWSFKVEFAWSDTCCIDKSSSTELDQSIRSMHRWYYNSDICIVHLAESETIEDMMYDEWTRRGWTLQELLAPVNIKFFNKYWMPMTRDANDKSPKKTEIMQKLEIATGIPHKDLWIFQPGPARVDERMTWAAKRKTTRVEDVAYSLMGMFDVSLQIAYGEGRDRAFSRLIEAIMQGGDPSVLNWTGEPLLHSSSRAIPRSPENFSGRTLQLPRDLGQLEMTMTSLGLRVPLVVLPLTLSWSIEQSRHKRNATLECPFSRTFRCTLSRPIGCKANVSDTVAEGHHQFALGIVNYSLVSYEAPQIAGKSVGCVLFRSATHRNICQPTSSAFVINKRVSPPKIVFGQWKKVSQKGLVEVNFPKIPSDSYIYISHEYLKIVYL